MQLHRLDAQLNHIASYGFAFVTSNIPFSINWPVSYGGMGGGGSVFGLAVASPNQFTGLTIPSGICTFDVDAIIGKCQYSATNGVAQGHVGLFGFTGIGTFPPITINAVSKASEVIPLPGYETMLTGLSQQASHVGGTATTQYAISAFPLPYVAKWEDGALAAYKTPADATSNTPPNFDQIKPQAIGGSGAVCYTTEDNNTIVIRDGGLNFVRRFEREELETFLGPSNTVNGQVISNFVFTGIGGR